MGENKSHVSGNSVIFPLTSLPIPACIRQHRISCTKSAEQTLYSTDKKVAEERGHNSTLSIFFIEVPTVNLFS